MQLYRNGEAHGAQVVTRRAHQPGDRIETSNRPRWGAIDTACGFNITGSSPTKSWKSITGGQRGITLQAMPYHRKCRFGHDPICTATEAAIIPVIPGNSFGIVFARLVQGAAPLLLSKTSTVELQASLRACQSELDLPDRKLRPPLARAGGGAFPVAAGSFHERAGQACQVDPVREGDVYGFWSRFQ